MSGDVSATVFGGILFSDGLTRTGFFAVLAAFVAINTILYAALAIAKILPKVYPSDWFRGPNRRSETRGIHPDGD